MTNDLREVTLSRGAERSHKIPSVTNRVAVDRRPHTRAHTRGSGMNYLALLIVAFVALVAGFFLGATTVLPKDGLNPCRKDNPGFDCKIGWVRSEPFA